MSSRERPVVLPGVGASGYVGACCLCHDTIEHGSKFSITCRMAIDGRFVQLAEHTGGCPPSRWCPLCTLTAGHADDCPNNPDALYVRRPITRWQAALNGELVP